MNILNYTMRSKNYFLCLLLLVYFLVVFQVTTQGHTFKQKPIKKKTNVDNKTQITASLCVICFVLVVIGQLRILFLEKIYLNL